MISTTYAMAVDVTVRVTDPSCNESYLTRRLSLPFAPYPGLALCLPGDDLNYVTVESCLWDTTDNVWRVDLREEDVPEPAPAFCLRTGWRIRLDM